MTTTETTTPPVSMLTTAGDLIADAFTLADRYTKGRMVDRLMLVGVVVDTQRLLDLQVSAHEMGLRMQGGREALESYDTAPEQEVASADGIPWCGSEYAADQGNLVCGRVAGHVGYHRNEHGRSWAA